jgi:hypothetical protein
VRVTVACPVACTADGNVWLGRREVGQRKARFSLAANRKRTLGIKITPTGLRLIRSRRRAGKAVDLNVYVALADAQPRPVVGRTFDTRRFRIRVVR